jgi:hypothetical protein
MQFDRAKLRAVILHTCQSCPPERLGAVKLHKVLYFLDMIHYAQSGSSVTGATYVKRPFGPTCSQLLRTLREMESEGSLEIREADYYGLRKKEYIAVSPPEAAILNDSERDLLNDVIDFVCQRNSARTISDYSHQTPWEMAEFGEEIPYHSSYLLIPSEVSPEAFEATEKGMGEVEASRPDINSVVFADFGVFRHRLREAVGRN